MLSKKCIHCGQVFNTYPSLQRIKYCSQQCYWVNKKGSTRPESVKQQISQTMIKKGIKPIIVLRGSNSNFWKGGVNKVHKPISRLIRDSTKYKHWRTAILHRDDFTCQRCNVRGGKLNVDHSPYSFISILKLFNWVTTLEDAYKIEFLWDTDNGVTLCERCHQKYGNKNFENAGRILFEELSSD